MLGPCITISNFSNIVFVILNDWFKKYLHISSRWFELDITAIIGEWFAGWCNTCLIIILWFVIICSFIICSVFNPTRVKNIFIFIVYALTRFFTIYCITNDCITNFSFAIFIREFLRDHNLALASGFIGSSLSLCFASIDIFIYVSSICQCFYEIFLLFK